MTEATRRKPILAALAFNVAVLLAMLASLASVTTYVPQFERAGLLEACGLAVASIGLVAFSWSRMPHRLRFLGIGTIGLAAVGGVYSASRLLG